MSEGKQSAIAALATLFSPDRLLSTCIHVCMIAGMMALWIGFQVKVMGNDIVLGGDEPTQYAKRK